MKSLFFPRTVEDWCIIFWRRCYINYGIISSFQISFWIVRVNFNLISPVPFIHRENYYHFFFQSVQLFTKTAIVPSSTKTLKNWFSRTNLLRITKLRKMHCGNEVFQFVNVYPIWTLDIYMKKRNLLPFACIREKYSKVNI